jgi:ribosomal protein S27AE
MATFQDGGRRRATANTVTAMKRNADRRRCPKCGRGAALVRLEDVIACRWGLEGKCDYVGEYGTS